MDTALLTGDGSSDSITGIVEQANTIAATLDVTDHILPISRETFRDNV